VYGVRTYVRTSSGESHRSLGAVNLDLQVVPRSVWCHHCADVDAELVETHLELTNVESSRLSIRVSFTSAGSRPSTSRHTQHGRHHILYSHTRLRPGRFHSKPLTPPNQPRLPNISRNLPSMMHVLTLLQREQMFWASLEHWVPSSTSY